MTGAARRWEAHTNHPWDAARAAEVDDELRRFLQGELPEYMVPSAVVVLDELPVGPNGKLDRRRLEAMVPSRSSGRPFVAPRSDLEHRVASAWRAVLGTDRVGVTDSFFELGGDSIQSIQLVSRINRMGYRLPVAALFQHPTVAALARLIESAEGGAAGPGPRPGAAGSYRVGELVDLGLRALVAHRPAVTHCYPLSPLQDHMLRRALLHPEPGLYVIHGISTVREDLDLERYQQAFDAVVEACPLFRTAFDWSDPGRPVQLVHRDVRSSIDFEDWTGLDGEAQRARLAERCEADRRRGFQLGIPDPPRLLMARRGPEDWLELLTAHYMRIDGWSTGELSRRMRGAYEEAMAGVATNPVTEDFGEYADWLAARDLAADRGFWAGVHAGVREAHGALPVRTSAGDLRFGRLARTLDLERSERLRAAARGRSVTLNAICQTAWALVLGVVTGRPDVLFGVAMSGRPAEIPGVERMIGPFLNFAPFPLHLDPDVQADQLVRGVHDRMLAMADRQWTSLSAIAGWWSAPNDRPLFDSYFVFQNLPGVRWSQVAGHNLSQTEWPLRVEVSVRSELELAMQFAESRLDASDVAAWLDLLESALYALAAMPAGTPLSAVQRDLAAAAARP